MADGLGEERGPFVEDLLREVQKAFEPLARREWLEWGAKVLFVEYQAKLEAEERVEMERRRREEEEEEQRRVADEKAKQFDERREALRAARATLTEEFRAKTVSKEALRERNAALQAEARAIEEEEQAGTKDEESRLETDVGEEKGEEGKVDEDEEVDGLPVIRMRKRRIEEVEENEEGEEEVDELEEDARRGGEKRPRQEETGLLVFKGPVSLIQSISNLLKTFCSVIVAVPSKSRNRAWSRTARRSALGARRTHGGAGGEVYRRKGFVRGSRERGSRRLRGARRLERQVSKFVRVLSARVNAYRRPSNSFAWVG
jgi:hypothetical protein